MPPPGQQETERLQLERTQDAHTLIWMCALSVQNNIVRINRNLCTFLSFEVCPEVQALNPFQHSMEDANNELEKMAWTPFCTLNSLCLKLCPILFTSASMQDLSLCCDIAHESAPKKVAGISVCAEFHRKRSRPSSCVAGKDDEQQEKMMT